MKAIVFQEHGGPEVLQYKEVPTPSPGYDEVLIKLEAAALNRLDIWVRQGWEGIRLRYPHIPGADGAGVIADMGPGVRNLSIGDRGVINPVISCGSCEQCKKGFDNQCSSFHLLGETMSGTYADYLVIPASNFLAMPDQVDSHHAAASALVYHTAWHSLITRGRLQPGESVLVVGASGGVNTACIQIAKLAGCKVFAVGSSRKKLALAESLGADFTVDRSQVDNWSKEIYRQTGKRGVDVVVDNVGTTFLMSMRAACKGGRILTVGNTGGPRFEIDNRFMFGKHLELIGSTMGTRHDFQTVMGFVFEGKLKPVIDQSFTLKDAAKAHRRLEAGEQMGKITLDIG